MIEIELYFTDLMDSLYTHHIYKHLHLYVIDVRFSRRPMEDIHSLILLHWLCQRIDFLSRKRNLEKRIWIKFVNCLSIFEIFDIHYMVDVYYEILHCFISRI